MKNVYTQMPQAQVFLNNTCELACHFCMNKYVKSSKYKYDYPDNIDSTKKRVCETTDVINAINFLIKCNVKCIELGTTIGEPLQHPISELENIFIYLESRPEIERYFFYTNLTKLNHKHIVLFNKYKKLHMKISCYGLTKQQFIVQTQRDVYRAFMRNIELLNEVKREPKMKILFAFRSPVKGKLERYGMELIKHKIKGWKNIEVTYEQTSEHFDWKRTINHKKSRHKPNQHLTGHCGMMLTDCGVLSNGDFTMCAWLDVYGDYVVGNIYKNTVDEIMSARESVIQEQNLGSFNNICKYCTLYTPSRGVSTNDPGGFNGD